MIKPLAADTMRVMMQTLVCPFAAQSGVMWMGQGLRPAPDWFREMSAELLDVVEVLWLVASRSCPDEPGVPQICAPGATWEDYSLV